MITVVSRLRHVYSYLQLTNDAVDDLCTERSVDAATSSDKPATESDRERQFTASSSGT